MFDWIQNPFKYSLTDGLEQEELAKLSYDWLLRLQLNLISLSSFRVITCAQEISTIVRNSCQCSGVVQFVTISFYKISFSAITATKSKYRARMKLWTCVCQTVACLNILCSLKQAQLLQWTVGHIISVSYVRVVNYPR